MINLSIDAADDMEGGYFDPTINEIESIVELVLEVILERNDAFPEYDEPDPEAEICMSALDYIIATSGVVSLEDKHYSIKLLSWVFVSMNYRNPVLSYHFTPPRQDF